MAVFDKVILLLVISSTLSEAITHKVQIHLCIYPPDMECSDCLAADVRNSTTNGKYFSLFSKFKNGNENYTEILDACTLRKDLHNLTKLQLKFVEESNDECENLVMCTKLHLPQKNYNMQCSITPTIVRENDDFSLCIHLNGSIMDQVALYPVIWITHEESLNTSVYITGDKAVLSLMPNNTTTGRYCGNTTFPGGHVPTAFFLFAVSVDGPAIATVAEECILYVLNKTNPLRLCKDHDYESLGSSYCYQEKRYSTCFHLEYKSISRETVAIDETLYPYLSDLISKEISAYYDFLYALQDVLIEQSDQVSTTKKCPTNCILQSLCANDTGCQITLLSGVPHLVAESLMTKLSQVQSVHISCCSVSCPDTGSIIGGVMGTMIIVMMILTVLFGAIACYYHHHYKSKTDSVPEIIQHNDDECYDNPNYAQEYRIFELEFPRHPNQESTTTAIRQKESTYIKWGNDFAGKSVRYSQLDVQEVIGEGEFGKVHKGRLGEHASHTEVAIKSLKSDNATVQEKEDFLAESAIMLDFNHPNVMKLVGVCFDTENNQPLILLPYMANGDLKSFLKSKRMNDTINNDKEHYPNGLSEAVLVKICLDIAQGMEYLSRAKFVHRDLAARNCMVDDRLTVCVSDFGLSRDIFYSDYYRLTHTARLPIKWMAPESLQDYIYSEKTDVWSFGVVCWEVFSLGCVPFPGVDNADILEYISKGNRPKQPPLCPINMYKIMHLAWKRAPEERPSFLQLALSLAELPGQDSASHDYYVLDMASEAREESLSQTPRPDISGPALTVS